METPQSWKPNNKFYNKLNRPVAPIYLIDFQFFWVILANGSYLLLWMELKELLVIAINILVTQKNKSHLIFSVIVEHIITCKNCFIVPKKQKVPKGNFA